MGWEAGLVSVLGNVGWGRWNNTHRSMGLQFRAWLADPSFFTVRVQAVVSRNLFISLKSHLSVETHQVQSPLPQVVGFLDLA